MEACKQCGAQAALHPIVGIVGTVGGDKTGAIAEQPGGAFAAFPICAECHKAPKLKAHYFLRQDSDFALRLAGMQSLALPGKR